MAADLFETYAVTVVATMVLASIFFAGQPNLAALMVYPLAICAACIVTSIIGTFFVKLGANNSIMGALYKGVIASGVLSIAGLYGATQYVLGGFGEVGDRRRPRDHRLEPVPVRPRRPRADRPHRLDHRVLHRHRLPPGALDQPGLGHRPRHQRHPGPRGVARSDRAADARHRRRHPGTYKLAGLFGTAIATTTMLGLAGVIVALDAFGPVTDNAGGIAEMAGLPKEVRRSTDALDAVGNTTKAVTKGYAIGSAGLGALVLFAAYSYDLQHFIDEANEAGSTVPVLQGRRGRLLAGQPLRRGRPAARRPDPLPVRRHRHDGRRPCGRLHRRGGSPPVQGQARHHEGHRAPDYARAVDLLTKAAIKEMVIPSLLPVLSPIVLLLRDRGAIARQGRGVLGGRRHAARRHRQRPVRRHLDDLGRRRLGQRQEGVRGRLRRQGRRQARQGLARRTRPRSPATRSAIPTRIPLARP